MVQENRALLTARRLLVYKLRDVGSSIRGNLRGFELKVGAISKGKFEAASASSWPAKPCSSGRRAVASGARRAACRIRHAALPAPQDSTEDEVWVH
jgi:hypothetical protein